jgi:hypothetical protein
MFIDDPRGRPANRAQLATDRLDVYPEAVDGAFGADVDHAQLIKIYGPTREETPHTPAECIGCETKIIQGVPDTKHISTSYLEPQNVTMRMRLRRFARLTNGFSKKIENHASPPALFYMHYNLCRTHQTLPVTPATEAGTPDHVWGTDELVALIPEPTYGSRGAHKKRN